MVLRYDLRVAELGRRSAGALHLPPPKKVTKTEAVQSQLDHRLDDQNIHIGPSDYVPWQDLAAAHGEG